MFIGSESAVNIPKEMIDYAIANTAQFGAAGNGSYDPEDKSSRFVGVPGIWRQHGEMGKIILLKWAAHSKRA